MLVEICTHGRSKFIAIAITYKSKKMKIFKFLVAAYPTIRLESLMIMQKYVFRNIEKCLCRSN